MQQTEITLPRKPGLRLPECLRSVHPEFMSNKQLVADLLERLPEFVTLQDIAKEIEFMAGVREGLDQLDRGEGIPVEEVEKMIASWITK